MKMVQEETRKGPWTEPEDLQLVYFVGIFGERRWDFIAKVSGLNRTGKSCRLRWVNYLHPGLKRGRMTPQEERLVLELHSRWGNRWSRIARKLPGRTDNEIKNYWRTHTRKKAQEMKRVFSPSSSSSNCYLSSSSSSSSLINPPTMGLLPKVHIDGDERGPSDLARDGENEELGANGYSMDQIWQEIASGEVNSGALYEGCEEEEGCNFSCPPPLASPWWDCSDSLWKMDGEEIKMMLPTGVVHFVSNSSLSKL